MADEKVSQLTNITGANLVDADEFYAIDQDGSAGSPTGPASRAITRKEASIGLTVQAELSESPISPDNTVSEYVFDVTDYVEVTIVFSKIGFAATDFPNFLVSTDGGSTYKQGAADYNNVGIDASTETGNEVAFIPGSDGTGTSGMSGRYTFQNLRAGLLAWHGHTRNGNSGRYRAGNAEFAGPITHIKILSGNGNNITDGGASGTIRVTGIRGSAA